MATVSLSICTISQPVLLHCWIPVGDLLRTSGEAVHASELMPFYRLQATLAGRVVSDEYQGERGLGKLHLTGPAPALQARTKSPSSAHDEIQRPLTPGTCTNHDDHKLG